MTDMQDIDHTHPHDDRSTGRIFQRGPTVVADGGQRTAEESDEGPTSEMRDVSHDAPEGDGANRVFERGGEHDGDVADR
ncbi:hypothetical protein [Halostella litorea]|uniref:hypothetical protein n=1 Tax=Halostella litorea TaxID=2528831 RepID=UPI00109260B3|nr:hypothetical protein [Halostella litorea]